MKIYIFLILLIFLTSCEKNYNVSVDVLLTKQSTLTTEPNINATNFTFLTSEILNNFLKTGVVYVDVLSSDETSQKDEFKMAEITVKCFYIDFNTPENCNSITPDLLGIKLSFEVAVTSGENRVVLVSTKLSKNDENYFFADGFVKDITGNTSATLELKPVTGLKGKTFVKSNSKENELPNVVIDAYPAIMEETTADFSYAKKITAESSNSGEYLLASVFSITDKVFNRNYFNLFMIASSDNNVGFSLPSKIFNFSEKDEEWMISQTEDWNKPSFVLDAYCYVASNFENATNATQLLKDYCAIKKDASVCLFDRYDFYLSTANPNIDNCFATQMGDMFPGFLSSKNIILYDKSEILQYEKPLVSSIHITKVTKEVSDIPIPEISVGEIPTLYNIQEMIKNSSLFTGNFYISGFNLYKSFTDITLSSDVSYEDNWGNAYLDIVTNNNLSATVRIYYTDTTEGTVKYYYTEYSGPLALYAINKKHDALVLSDDERILGFTLQNKYPFFKVYKVNKFESVICTSFNNGVQISETDLTEITKTQIPMDFETKIYSLYNEMEVKAICITKPETDENGKITYITKQIYSQGE